MFPSSATDSITCEGPARCPYVTCLPGISEPRVQNRNSQFVTCDDSSTRPPLRSVSMDDRNQIDSLEELRSLAGVLRGLDTAASKSQWNDDSAMRSVVAAAHAVLAWVMSPTSVRPPHTARPRQARSHPSAGPESPSPRRYWPSMKPDVAARESRRLPPIRFVPLRHRWRRSVAASSTRSDTSPQTGHARFSCGQSSRWPLAWPSSPPFTSPV